MRIILLIILIIVLACLFINTIKIKGGNQLNFMCDIVPNITTERLTIKQAYVKDLPTINNILKTGGDFIYLKKISKNNFDNTKYFIAYSNKKPIAVTGFKYVKWNYIEPRFSNTSTVVLPEYRNRGYMSEIQKALTRYILHNTSINTISVQIHKDNIANIKVMKKIGYVVEFERDDHVFMKIIDSS